MGLTLGTRGEERSGVAVVTIIITWLLSCHHLHESSAPRFPAGFVSSGTDGGGRWCWLWGSSPWSLAADPLRGLPGCSSSLVTRLCFDPRSLQEARSLQIWSVLERKWIWSWHCRCLLSDRQLHGRGAPALAETCCQLFSTPLRTASSSSARPDTSAVPATGIGGGAGLFPERHGGFCPPQQAPGLQRALPWLQPPMKSRWVFLCVSCSHRCRVPVLQTGWRLQDGLPKPRCPQEGDARTDAQTVG